MVDCEFYEQKKLGVYFAYVMQINNLDVSYVFPFDSNA